MPTSSVILLALSSAPAAAAALPDPTQPRPSSARVVRAGANDPLVIGAARPVLPEDGAQRPRALAPDRPPSMSDDQQAPPKYFADNAPGRSGLVTRLRELGQPWFAAILNPLGAWYTDGPARTTQPRGRPEFEPHRAQPLQALFTWLEGTDPWRRSAPSASRPAAGDVVPVPPSRVDDLAGPRPPARAPARVSDTSCFSTPNAAPEMGSITSPPIRPSTRAALEAHPPTAPSSGPRDEQLGRRPAPTPARAPEPWYASPLQALFPWWLESPPGTNRPRGRPEFEPWRSAPLEQLGGRPDDPAPPARAATRARQLGADVIRGLFDPLPPPESAPRAPISRRAPRPPTEDPGARARASLDDAAPAPRPGVAHRSSEPWASSPLAAALQLATLPDAAPGRRPAPARTQRPAEAWIGTPLVAVTLLSFLEDSVRRARPWVSPKASGDLSRAAATSSLPDHQYLRSSTRAPGAPRGMGDAAPPAVPRASLVDQVAAPRAPGRRPAQVETAAAPLSKAPLMTFDAAPTPPRTPRSPRGMGDGWTLPAFVVELFPWFEQTPPRTTAPRGRPEREPWFMTLIARAPVIVARVGQRLRSATGMAPTNAHTPGVASGSGTDQAPTDARGVGSPTRSKPNA